MTDTRLEDVLEADVDSAPWIDSLVVVDNLSTDLCKVVSYEPELLVDILVRSGSSEGAKVAHISFCPATITVRDRTYSTP